jgi:hypothetical protein
MFSNFKRVYVNVDTDDSVNDCCDILNNIDIKNTTILYTNAKISKYLFRKGVKGVCFICSEQSNPTHKIVNIGKPDLIINSTANGVTDSGISLFNYTTKKYICGDCKEETDIIDKVIPKVCSEECALINHPGVYELLTKCKKENNLTKSFSNKKKEMLSFSNEKVSHKEAKFNKVMMIEAKRHAYLTKKEEYKRNFRLSSNVKTDFGDETGSVETKPKKNITVKMCKATTKKDKKPCSNKAIKGSEYCGIVSHRKLDKNAKPITKKKSSSLTKLNRLKRK